MPINNTYELSLSAEIDLTDIYDYTFKNFGAVQAKKYLLSIEDVFNKLCTHPNIGRERDEVRIGLRSISHHNHVIFYRFIKKNVRIIRVLHSSRDVHKFI